MSDFHVKNFHVTNICLAILLSGFWVGAAVIIAPRTDVTVSVCEQPAQERSE